jgi:PAS domain S-box-containing protein
LNTAQPDLSLSADLAALARDALLDHLARNDPTHALRYLVAALSQRLGGECTLLRQSLHAPGPLPELAEAAGALPLAHLGQHLGWLQLPPGLADSARQAVADMTPTLAALVGRVPRPDSPEHPSHRALTDTTALILAALRGAGTFVWEWQVDTDWLSDIDEGLLLLGYAGRPMGHTQADWNSLIHPDDRVANHEAYLRHERGEVDTYEHVYRALAADGQWRWLLERGRVVERHPDGRPRRMLGTQTDITERRALEQAASQAKDRLMRIAEHVPGILYQFRQAADGSVAFPLVSPRTRALFGIEPTKLEQDALALMRLVHPDDRDMLVERVNESANAGTPWQVDFRIQRRDTGALRWMHGSASPQHQLDGSTLWHGYIEDVTERRELDQARQRAAAEAAANRAKTEFLSRMSHELRTPLNAVMGFTQLMEVDQAEPPSEGQRRRLRLVREAGSHLLQMIGDLLDLTRIEAGHLALALEPVSLRAAVLDALALVRESADRAQLALHVDDGPDTLVLADPTRLRQVLLNLLSNAIKYNRPGGRVVLTVWATADGLAHLRVVDTGVGIAEDDLPRVFEPYHRGQQAQGRVEGHGIGLSVTQALVKLMGGQIQASSTLGQGATFTVALPQASTKAG